MSCLRRTRGSVLLIGWLSLASCARAQTVLEIDTNVPIPRMGDTLRIDVLRADGTVIESRSVFAGNRGDWPLSFGLTAESSTRVRLRLYFAAKAAASVNATDDAGSSMREPLVPSTIDRLVELDRPSDGVRRVRVLLRGDCMGIPSDSTANTTCVDSASTSASPRIGGGDERTARSLVGTWSAAAEVDCVGTPRPNSARFDGESCVKGGVFFLGDERVGSTPCLPNCGASPERIVRISPFFMDQYEVTVGRWGAALSAGFRPQFPVWNASPACTGTMRNGDALPINCVAFEDARRFCQWDGGRDLPTEAQVEFVATGRGRELEYVWGSANPNCTFASYARFRVPGTSGAVFANVDECIDEGEGPQQVGSFALDQTQEGIFDLAGNLGEWTLDALESFDRGCWARQRYGMLLDPVCDRRSDERVRRGGTWGHTAIVLSPNWRASIPITRIRTTPGDIGTLYGFRCVRSAR